MNCQNANSLCFHAVCFLDVVGRFWSLFWHFVPVNLDTERNLLHFNGNKSQFSNVSVVAFTTPFQHLIVLSLSRSRFRVTVSAVRVCPLRLLRFFSGRSFSFFLLLALALFDGSWITLRGAALFRFYTSASSTTPREGEESRRMRSWKTISTRRPGDARVGGEKGGVWDWREGCLCFVLLLPWFFSFLFGGAFFALR